MTRLILHVGPHRTGTTSIQKTLHRARLELAADGILYPESTPEAHYPEQHSDLALLVKARRSAEVRQYCEDVLATAVRSGCPVILLSGEEFSSLVQDEAFIDLVEGLRGLADVDLVYVQRKVSDVIRSNIMQQVMGNVFTLAHRAADFDDRIADSYRWIGAQQRFFQALDAIFLDFETLAGDELPLRFIERITGRSLTYLEPNRSNSTAGHITGDPLLFLAAPLRLLIAIKGDQPVDAPACYREAAALLANASVDREAVNALLRDFNEHLKHRVEAVVARLE